MNLRVAVVARRDALWRLADENEALSDVVPFILHDIVPPDICKFRYIQICVCVWDREDEGRVPRLAGVGEKWV